MLTLHNVIILIKSVLNKDQNHYYYEIFLENVRISYLKNNDRNAFDSIIMLRFGDIKTAKKEFYVANNVIKIGDVAIGC